jgi:SnoaL-like protein
LSATTDDRLAIHELIHLHGHLMDGGEFDRLAEFMTPDCRYDVTALGGGVLRGLAALEAAGRALGDRNPLAHHVTNVVVTSLTAEEATVLSKGLSVMSDGSTGSVVYEDVVRRTPAGWRLAARTIRPRRRPLTP